MRGGARGGAKGGRGWWQLSERAHIYTQALSATLPPARHAPAGKLTNKALAPLLKGAGALPHLRELNLIDQSKLGFEKQEALVKKRKALRLVVRRVGGLWLLRGADGQELRGAVVMAQLPIHASLLAPCNELASWEGGWVGG